MRKFLKVAKKFASWHPDMLHVDKSNKRFFLIQNIVAMPDFITTLPKNQSPCIGMDMTPDVNIWGQKKTWVHTLYIFVREGNGKPNDTEGLMDSIEKGYEIADTFRRWVYDHQEKKHDADFMGIEIEQERAYVMGPMMNNWMAVCLPVEMTEHVSDQLSDFVEKGI